MPQHHCLQCFRLTDYSANPLMNMSCLLYRIMSSGSVCWLIFHQAHWDYLVLKGNSFISAEVEERGFNSENSYSIVFDCFLHLCSDWLPLPACVWPLTSCWPVTCRHPLWLPLMCCLLLCTVGVNHTPWESDVEFHTMGPLACVVWGLREGLEIKGQPVCEVNSREQYFTHSTFSQRMLMSVDFLSTWCFWLKGWWLPGLCVFFPCFHFSPGIYCRWM